MNNNLLKEIIRKLNEVYQEEVSVDNNVSSSNISNKTVVDNIIKELFLTKKVVIHPIKNEQYQTLGYFITNMLFKMKHYIPLSKEEKSIFLSLPSISADVIKFSPLHFEQFILSNDPVLHSFKDRNDRIVLAGLLINPNYKISRPIKWFIENEENIDNYLFYLQEKKNIIFNHPLDILISFPRSFNVNEAIYILEKSINYETPIIELKGIIQLFDYTNKQKLFLSLMEKMQNRGVFLYDTIATTTEIKNNKHNIFTYGRLLYEMYKRGITNITTHTIINEELSLFEITKEQLLSLLGLALRENENINSWMGIYEHIYKRGDFNDTEIEEIKKVITNSLADQYPPEYINIILSKIEEGELYEIVNFNHQDYLFELSENEYYSSFDVITVPEHYQFLPKIIKGYSVLQYLISNNMPTKSKLFIPENFNINNIRELETINKMLINREIIFPNIEQMFIPLLSDKEVKMLIDFFLLHREDKISPFILKVLFFNYVVLYDITYDDYLKANQSSKMEQELDY